MAKWMDKWGDESSVSYKEDDVRWLDPGWGNERAVGIEVYETGKGRWAVSVHSEEGGVTVHKYKTKSEARRVARKLAYKDGAEYTIED